MGLISGTKLGPYQILATLGVGGMGEVYRARDTKLGRDVALKILPERFACDSDRMARFRREAQVLAALNHPHIATIYGVEESGGVRALVMEVVEGTPLKGPLPLRQAVEYAGQILEALDAAHRKGISHRDLKPANILVTKQGIKLLDFGLAKQSGPLQETDATLTAALTGKGQIVGTLQYISPEQLQGKEADTRADLFSFGCVLYEMLTGKRAFEGQSPASVIAAILEREPAPLDVVRPLERVVRRSLAKDPDQRFQTARDLKAALTWAIDQPSAPAVAKLRSRVSWAAVAGALAAALALALWAPWRARVSSQASPQQLVRLDVDLGDDVSLNSIAGPDVILSPDGSRLVFVSKSRLFTRRLDQPNATELTGTEGARAPFFSPDGQWVAFFLQGKLEKVSVQGGPTIALCNAGTGEEGGTWGEDGNIIAQLGTGPLFRIPSTGGAPTPVTELGPGETAHRWPQILPGSRAVLFSSYTPLRGINWTSIEVMSFGDRQRKTLQRGGSYGRYLPSGHLVYFNRNTMLAVPFDLNRLEVRGTPVPVLEGVSYSTAMDAVRLDFSRTGMLVYRTSGAGGGLATVQWLDSAGKEQPLLAKPGDYQYPTLSPDGHRLALTSAGDIWVYESRSDTMTRLTFGGGSIPVWSPDGRYIVFQAAGGMFWTRSDGAGKPQPLTQSKNPQAPWSFTPDGKRLAFDELNPGSERDLWTVPLESNAVGLRAGKPEAFLQTSFDERHPSFSPDGRWLAYTSNESGTFQVYVRAFPGASSAPGAKWAVSTGGGMYPVWARDEHELFCRSFDGQIMVTSYDVKGDSFIVIKPRVWFEKSAGAGFYTPWLGNPRRNFDIAADGKRIIALMPVEIAKVQPQHHVIFLLNFFDYLRQRVPLGSK